MDWMPCQRIAGMTGLGAGRDRGAAAMLPSVGDCAVALQSGKPILDSLGGARYRRGTVFSTLIKRMCALNGRWRTEDEKTA
jgi:hypothetical protein